MVSCILIIFHRGMILQLTQRLSGEFEDFNCSESQLLDIATRISMYTIADELRNEAINLVQAQNQGTCMSYAHECAYWNSHVLSNCSAYDTAPSRGSGTGEEGPGNVPSIAEARLLALVQRNVLERQWGYRRFCLGNKQFCPIPTVLL